MKTVNNLKSIFLIAPTQSKIWICLPLSYTLLVQLITGVPHPSALQRLEQKGFLTRVSEELFDYPYWLQDLSHLPIFFLFYWVWSWFLKRKDNIFKTIDLSFIWSLIYALINELLQFFVPNRFPSIGDILMNISGVFIATFLYKMIWQKIDRKY